MIIIENIYSTPEIQISVFNLLFDPQLMSKTDWLATAIYVTSLDFMLFRHRAHRETQVIGKNIRSNCLLYTQLTHYIS